MRGKEKRKMEKGRERVRGRRKREGAEERECGEGRGEAKVRRVEG